MKNIFQLVNKYKHRLATFALIFGFLVDLITFRTINLELSQLILSVHLTIVALAILITSRPQKEGTSKLVQQIRSFVPIIHQYSIGNLLSAFLILYSASGSLMQSWPFLFLVAIAVVGNETLTLQKYRLPFQTTLFFLALTLFFVLSVPMTVNAIGVGTFLLGLFVSGVVFIVFVWAGRRIAHHAFATNKMSIRFGWIGMLFLIMFLYFTNLIPPIPLSLKDSSVYHSVERVGDTYVVEDQKREWYERFFDFGGVTLDLAHNEPAYLYTAVFAPAELDTTVVHKWQFFDIGQKEWVTTNVVEFPIAGGRRGGYRGFSFSESPREGKWRVSVETKRGQVVGRVFFNVKRVQNPVETTSKTID